MTPTSIMTPMICDPPPGPDRAPRRTPSAEVALPGFEARSVQVIPDRIEVGIEVWGTVRDHLGNPVSQAKITLMAPGTEITSRTSDSGAYSLRVSAPGAYRMFVGVDQSHSVPLELKLHDLALVEWVGTAPGSQAPLPLAEIRTVKIAQVAADSAFGAGVGFRRRVPLAEWGLQLDCLGRDVDGVRAARALAAACRAGPLSAPGRRRLGLRRAGGGCRGADRRRGWPRDRFLRQGPCPLAIGSSRTILVVEDLGQQHLPARSLAAVLRRAGWDARLVDFGRAPDGSTDGDERTGAVIALAEHLRPRLIVFSILFADRVSDYLALIAALRRAGVRAHLTLAGPLPSFAPAELLAACPALDSVLCGEAEASVAALAAGLDDPTLWRDVPGLAYREAGSLSVRANPWPAAVAELDDLPWPQRDAADTSFHGYGFATIQGSRGCYHACAMCLPCAFYRATPGGHYRLRSIPNLVDEIEALYRQGTRLFLFDDEQFLPPGEARVARVEAFAGEIARRELAIAFTIKCRPDDVEAGILRRLQEIGLLRVYVGIESGCQATLDLLGKGVTVQRNIEALAALDHLGLVADFFCLMFHPWSTPETIEAELAFLEQAIPQHATVFSFSEVAVFPGTPLARRLRGEGRGGRRPWPLAYRIADPRAELLRRLNGLIFGAATAHDRIRDRITQAWFALLLARRFHPQASDAEQFDMLKALARSLNRGTLDVWQAMAAFARQEDIRDAPRVNTCAGEWAGAVRAACLRAEDALSALMPERPR